jgi:hypothetical protein
MKEELEKRFHMTEAQPFGCMELITIWILMACLFIFWFEPTFNDQIANMIPEKLSPWFEQIKARHIH